MPGRLIPGMMSPIDTTNPADTIMTVGGSLVEFDISKGVLYEKGMAHHLQNTICPNDGAGYVEYRDQIPKGS